MDDLAFIERLWADWSPGYDASADLPHVKDALRNGQLKAAIGYYQATLGGVGLDPDPEVQALQDASAEPPRCPPLPARPDRRVHGRRAGRAGGAGLTTHPGRGPRSWTAPATSCTSSAPTWSTADRRVPAEA